MTIPNPLRRLRLIPAVMLLSATLLVVKGAGLAMDAKAQEQQSAPAAQATDQSAPSADPAVSDEDTDTSSAQVDVLSSLAKRRAELDGRERDLDMRENLIAAAEKRVDGKIDSLKQLQTQIQALLVQSDAAEQKQLDTLVKTYSSMRPKDAARIFDNLNDDVLLAVAGQMKPDILGAILAQMQPDAAQKLTVKLANRVKLPDAQAQASTAPQQLASTTPVAPPAAAPQQAVSAPQPAAPQPAATSPAANKTPTAQAPTK